MGVHLQWHVPQNLPRLEMQMSAIRQALLNLLSLAICTQSQALIRLEAMAREREIVFIISCPFPLSTSDEQLSLILRLIEPSGGQLEVLDNAIHMTLPTSLPVKVLGVDDNHDTLRLWQRYVSATNYAIISVQDAGQVVEAAMANQPDIFVLDVMLPGIDGGEPKNRILFHFRQQLKAIHLRHDQIQ
jgi:hypothetical protein